MHRLLTLLAPIGIAIGVVGFNSPGQVGITPAAPPAATAQPKPESDPAVVAIEKAGGSVLLDNKHPDRPVIEVRAPFNKATDADFIKLASFKKLRNLYIAQNSGIYASTITGVGFKDLAHLQDLESITASLCPITDEGVSHIAVFRKLKVLHFANAKFSDTGMKQLAKLEKLEVFSMYDVRRQGPGKDEPRDATIALIGNFKNLRELNIAYTEAGDLTAKAIAGLPLKKLTMYNTPITDKGMAELAKLKLEELHIGGSNMGDAGLSAFAGQTQMKSLAFAYASGVTDKSVKTLSTMTGLTYLKVFMTSITPKGVEELKKALPKCGVRQ